MTEPAVEFEQLLEYVRDARGFDFTGYRRPTLLRRFDKRRQAVGADDWRAYRDHLENDQDEFAALFDSILINVTSFFRDRETWDVVAEEVVPRILEQKDQRAPIRVWSAGCATGEEAYTVLMLLGGALDDDELKERVKIYATDIDDGALMRGREAAYTAKQMEPVAKELRDRFFQSVGNSWAIRKDLRRCVIFGRNDLHRDPPISHVDLLVSRNTLMYFGTDVQERILANFYFALNRGGFLVVGKAEALQGGRRRFTAYNLKRRIFLKDGAADVGFRVPQLPVPELQPREPSLSELRDVAFEHAPIAQIVTDEENRVAAINQPARAMFDLRLRDVGRPLQDLDISYRPVELRSLIDEVRERRRQTSVKGVRWEAANGEARALDVQVAPLVGPGDRLVGVSIAFVDVTLHRALEDDLDVARRELETAYAELQTTVEELETTNEELQSTNEELETMNEELHSTNEELETMNDELRERTDETIHANAFLASVLSGIRQAVVVVDAELHVIAWNRIATDLWGLRDSEVEGQHLLNLDIGLPVETLRDPVRHVLSGDVPDEMTVGGHDRRGRAVTYTVGFTPLQRQADGSVVGAILMATAARQA